MSVNLKSRPAAADGTPKVSLDGPSEQDKKPVFVESPATTGFKTWIVSRADDFSPTPPATGRGDGTKMLHEMKPTFDLPRRLATWASRELGGKKGGTSSRIYREP